MSPPLCCCCGFGILPRIPDPWGGRMDDYCRNCCLLRCDVEGRHIATPPAEHPNAKGGK